MLRNWLLLGLLLWTWGMYAPQCEAGAHEKKRSRVEMRVGYWNPSGSSEATADRLVRQRVENLMWSIAYVHQYKENLAMTVRFAGLVVEAGQSWGFSGISQGAIVVMPLLFGVRYEYPLSSPIRPYLAASAGPYFLNDSGQRVGVSGIAQGVGVQAALGTHLGGGVDFAIGKRFVIGASAGYHLIANFSEAIGGRKNFSGPEVSAGLSFLWGRAISRGIAD